MKKITALMASFLTCWIAGAQTSPLGDASLVLNAEKLNALTTNTRVALKNISGSNNYWYAGTKNIQNLTPEGIFEVEKSADGKSFYLKKAYGDANQYIQQGASGTQISLGAKATAASFKGYCPVTGETGKLELSQNGEDWQMNGIDYANMVRFVYQPEEQYWINVKEKKGKPVYNSGKGGYTVNIVYNMTDFHVVTFNITKEGVEGKDVQKVIYKKNDQIAAPKIEGYLSEFQPATMGGVDCAFDVQYKKLINVVYAYYLNGKMVVTKTKGHVLGSPYSAPAVDEYYLEKGEVSGTVAATNDTVKVICSEKELPFAKSASVENATWYFMNIKGDKVVHDGDGQNINLAANTARLEDMGAQWCFVGNVVDGFKIYNRDNNKRLMTTSDMKSQEGANTNNGGANNVYCKAGEPDATANETDTWFLKEGNEIGGKKGFYLGVKTSDGTVKYSNDRNGKLAFWTGGADAGSTYLVSNELPVMPMTAVGQNTYTTVYLPFAAQTPANVKAFYGELTGNTVVMHAIADGVVPANTGVVLKGENGTVNVTLTIASNNDAAVLGDLKGSLVAKNLTPEEKSKYWVLGNHPTSGLGFYHLNAESLAANKAYVQLENATVNGLNLDFGEATGIESVVENPTAEKVIFDLSGRRVQKMTKGLYIVNGKKVLVK